MIVGHYVSTSIVQFVSIGYFVSVGNFVSFGHFESVGHSISIGMLYYSKHWALCKHTHWAHLI